MVSKLQQQKKRKRKQQDKWSQNNWLPFNRGKIPRVQKVAIKAPTVATHVRRAEDDIVSKFRWKIERDVELSNPRQPLHEEDGCVTGFSVAEK